MPRCVVGAFGLSTGLAPAVLIAASSGIDVTVFNNFTFHRVNAAVRADEGDARAIEMTGKVVYSAEYLLKGSGIVLLGGLVAAAVVHHLRRRSAGREPRSGHTASRAGARWLAGLVTVATFLAAFGPTPMQRDYLASLVPFAAIWAAALTGPYLRHRAGQRIAAGLAVVSLVIGFATTVRYVRYLPSPQAWIPLRIAAAGRELAELMSENEAGPKSSVDRPDSARLSHGGRPLVATLAPLVALEGGLVIYPEMATGVFAYRVYDRLTPDQRRLLRGVGPAGVSELLARRSPAAILVDFPKTPDAALRAAAERAGYAHLRLRAMEATVYFP